MGARRAARARVGERRPPVHEQRLRCAHVEQEHAALDHLVERGQVGGQRVVLGARLVDVERGEHREDHLAFLHRGDVTGRERVPVAIAIDVEQHGAIGPAGPQEVAVQRMRVTVGPHRETRGHQRLRGDLPAEQRRAQLGVGAVDAAEEIAVETLDVEDGPQLAGGRVRTFGFAAHGAMLPRARSAAYVWRPCARSDCSCWCRCSPSRPAAARRRSRPHSARCRHHARRAPPPPRFPKCTCSSPTTTACMHPASTRSCRRSADADGGRDGRRPGHERERHRRQVVERPTRRDEDDHRERLPGDGDPGLSRGHDHLGDRREQRDAATRRGALRREQRPEHRDRSRPLRHGRGGARRGQTRHPGARRRARALACIRTSRAVPVPQCGGWRRVSAH